jgi:hypothetical protein
VAKRVVINVGYGDKMIEDSGTEYNSSGIASQRIEN